MLLILLLIIFIEIGREGQDGNICLIFPEKRSSKIATKLVKHYYWVMKKVTIILDEEVARWARIRAAAQNTSISRLVGEMLKEKMGEEEVYFLAMQQYLAKKPQVLKKAGAPYPRREELHER